MAFDFTGSAFVSESLVLGNALSSTPSGTLYFARDTIKGDPYAVRCIPADHHRESRIYDSLAELEHPNIQKHHFTFKRARHLFCVMDHCNPSSSLAAAIKDDIFYEDEDRLKRLFLQLLDAIEECHKKNIFHLDLRPENVFLEDDGRRVVLANFAHASSTASSSGGFGGDDAFRSPEMSVTDGSTEYSHSCSDIWSLGIIFFAMIAGQTPWSNACTIHSESATDDNFLEFQYDMTFFVKKHLLSMEANRLLRRILVINPGCRLSLRGIRREVNKIRTFYLSEKEIFSPRIARLHWLHSSFDSTPSSPSLDSSPNSDEEYIYSPPVVDCSPIFKCSISSADCTSATGLASANEGSLLNAFKLLAGTDSAPLSSRLTLRRTALAPESASRNSRQESASPNAGVEIENGLFLSTGSRNSAIWSSSESSSAESSEGCVTPGDELDEFPTDCLGWGRYEDIEVVSHSNSDLDAGAEEGSTLERTPVWDDFSAEIEEYDLFAPPKAPKPSPRLSCHGHWGRHNGGEYQTGVEVRTPKMATTATSPVLHYAVELLHAFPQEPVRRWT